MRPDPSVLDNAVWHSLTGPHASMAEGDGGARRYPADVSVFCATDGDSAESWSTLRDLAPDTGVVVLFRGDPIEPPDRWKPVFDGGGFQYVAHSSLTGVPALPDVDPETGRRVTARGLGDDDLEQMIALVALTKPGPFGPRTIELGGYVGIFHDEQLVAMAGQRLRPPGFCEVSAVCTHPGARRRGYGSIVTALVATSIAERGDVPFLHVAEENVQARAVYERLGFSLRRSVRFAALRVPA